MFSNSAQNLQGAPQIAVMKGLAAVRKRADMYIGNTADGTGLHNIVFKVCDLALEEVLACVATEVSDTLNADGSASVRDDGRGMPTGVDPVAAISMPELLMTQLSAGGISGGDSGGGCIVPGGVHTAGVSVVNALSSRLDLRIWRDGTEHIVRFRDGIADAPLAVVGPAGGRHGTEITFWPSPSMFCKAVDFDYDTLERRLHEMAAFCPRARIVLNDHRPGGRRQQRICLSGIADLLRYLDRVRKPLLEAPITIVSDEGGNRAGLSFEVALWWNDSPPGHLACYAETLPLRSGGTLLAGIRAAVGRAITRYAQQHDDADREKVQIIGDDARSGLTAVVAIWNIGPSFQTDLDDADLPERLSVGERYCIESVVADRLSTWLDAHPTQAQAILANVRKAASGRAICDFVQRSPTTRS